MKKTTHNFTESVEQQHFKKKYLARKLEEQEAQKLINDFTYTPSDEVSYPSPMDEKRTM
jgi:hypothetical protein